MGPPDVVRAGCPVVREWLVQVFLLFSSGRIVARREQQLRKLQSAEPFLCPQPAARLVVCSLKASHRAGHLRFVVIVAAIHRVGCGELEWDGRKWGWHGVEVGGMGFCPRDALMDQGVSLADEGVSLNSL